MVLRCGAALDAIAVRGRGVWSRDGEEQHGGLAGDIGEDDNGQHSETELAKDVLTRPCS